MNASPHQAHHQFTAPARSLHWSRSTGRARGEQMAASIESTIRQHQCGIHSRLRLYAVPEIEHSRGRFRVSRRLAFRGLLLVVNGDRYNVETADMDKVDLELAIEVTAEEALRIARGMASTPDALRPSGFAWPTA